MRARLVKGVDKLRGLMFRRRCNAEPLLFDFKKPVRHSIHSFFVFFKFKAIFLDENNNIIAETIIHPFEFVKPNNYYHKLLEVPA